jgi:hypothetical protein
MRNEWGVSGGVDTADTKYLTVRRGAAAGSTQVPGLCGGSCLSMDTSRTATGRQIGILRRGFDVCCRFVFASMYVHAELCANLHVCERVGAEAIDSLIVASSALLTRCRWHWKRH